MTQMPIDVDEAVEELELDLLLTAMSRRYGYDFSEYSRKYVRRRVRQAMIDEGLASLSALQDKLLRDPECLHRIVRRLTVHVTSMFRDPAFYRALRVKVLPILRTYPYVRVWHAGCSTGEEVYSLAIVLEEEGLYDRCRLYATDISDVSLAKARRGVFALDAMRGYTANYHGSAGKRDFSSYYVAEHGYAIMRESLRRNVVFSQHNLVSDGSFNEFHLILCRNVLMYFDRGLRGRVYALLHSSLVRFGVLVLGASETIDFTPYAGCFVPLDDDLRIYQLDPAAGE